MPRRTLTLPGWRNAAVSTAAQWNSADGVGLNTWSVNATNAGGFYAGPLVLPVEADPSYGMDAYLTIRNPLLLTTTSRVIVFETTVSYLNPGEAVASVFAQLFWGSPDNWPAGDWTTLSLRSDSAPDDPLIPPATFKAGARIAIRAWRASDHANDNFPHAIQMLGALALDFNLRCQTPCC